MGGKREAGGGGRNMGGTARKGLFFLLRAHLLPCQRE